MARGPNPWYSIHSPLASAWPKIEDRRWRKGPTYLMAAPVCACHWLVGSFVQLLSPCACSLLPLPCGGLAPVTVDGVLCIFSQPTSPNGARGNRGNDHDNCGDRVQLRSLRERDPRPIKCRAPGSRCSPLCCTPPPVATAREETRGRRDCP
jgi:hypothetical protein